MDKNTRVSIESKLATIAGLTTDGRIVAALDELDDVFAVVDAEVAELLPTPAEVKQEMDEAIKDSKAAYVATKSGQWEYAKNSIRDAIRHIRDLIATLRREVNNAKAVYSSTKSRVKSTTTDKIAAYNAGRRF